MKKTILTAMLFFAFLVLGIQSASAQQYVNNDTASDLLEAEIQSVLEDPAYTGATAKDAQFIYFTNKVELFTFVNDRIAAGSSVADAITLGVMTLPSGNTTSGQWVAVKANPKSPDLTPLHQELVDLLEQ